MADRIYPSAKPNANGSAANATTTATTTTANPNPSFPATKAQLYGATRPAYRPQPHHRRRSHSRGCCCSCCLWFSLLILLLIFFLAIAGAVVYLLYRPHRPTFSVSSLKISSLKLTSSSPHLATTINLNVSATNPNKKLLYFYDPITISLTTDDNIPVGRGTFPSFVHPTKNTTLLKAVITNGDQQQLDEPSVAKLKTELKRKDGLPLKIKLETKVKAKMGVLKTPKVRARISCEGIKASVPTGKSSTMASTSDAKCKVDLRIKIWKWTF